MKRFTSIPIVALLCLIIALIADFFGCETGLRDPKPEMSVQTKQAVDIVPRDVQFFGTIDFEKTKSDIEDHFFGHNNALFDQMEGEIADHFEDFIEASGIDPQEDFYRAFAALDIDKSDGNAYLVLYLDYDRDRLQAFIDENLSEEFGSVAYRGIPVYYPIEKPTGESAYVALVNDEMMIGSTRMKEVEGMIDRLNGEGESISDDAETMDLIERVAGGNGWAVARDLDEIPQIESENSGASQAIVQMSRVVQDAAVSFEVSGDEMEGRAWLAPIADVSSKDLASLTKGAIAALKTLFDLDSEEVEMLDEMNVRRRGDLVRVDFDVDIPEVEEMEHRDHKHEHRHR